MVTGERRRYFRIDDRVLIKYRVVQEEALEREKQSVYLNRIRAENARAALLGIDSRLEELIPAIRSENPTAADALDLLNRKIALLERVVALGEHEEIGTAGPEHVPMEVNLSGGGIAITAATPVAPSAHLAIDIVLLAMHYPVRLFGRVVDCRVVADKRYRISIEFEGIPERDRDLIIQHVLHKQSETLRLTRHGARPGG